VLKFDDHAACTRLWMIKRCADCMNGADRNAGGIERFDQ
jgi:hypothetical protein